jgi:hypothetical protein
VTPEGLSDSRAPQRLQIAPGFFSENTARSSEGRWKDGDRVRFKNGLPQKIGGWVEADITGDPYYGVARSMHEWVSHDGESWVALGTSEKLYLINRGIRHDITPIRDSGTLGTDPFAVVDTSDIVTVTDVAHGAAPGDFVRFSGATAGGGITIDGEYRIIEVLDADSYTIQHSAAATSTDPTTGGASVAYEYDINIGSASNQTAVGYGTGPYGEGTYGTPRDVAASDLFQYLRIWSLGNFGEDLIASPSGGAIYHWDKTNGVSTRAVLLSDAPETNMRVFMSSSKGRIICLGAYDPVAGADDPLNIIAGAEESLDEFEVVDESSDVYTERVTIGSRLVGGLNTAGGELIWTDTAVFLLIPDPTEIYRLRTISATNAFCGPNAALDINGTVIGMASDKFMRFDGAYTELPCDVWGDVFDNEDGERPGLNKGQLAKVHAWNNELFSEAWWFYPGRDSDENDRAVIYNYAEGVWYHLTIERTTALRKGTSYGVPTAVDSAGALYRHETGTTDNGDAMGEFIESYDMMIGEGPTSMHISRYVPDMKRQVGTLLLTLKAKNKPEDIEYKVKGPYALLPTTKTKAIRIKGRQVAIRIEGGSIDSDWRYGAPTLYAQPDAVRS